MLTVRVIPCLDVDGGRVVKGVRFQELRDSGDPAELAKHYATTGADEIVLLDISATTEARRTRLDTVQAVRNALDIPLTVGGGVRSVADAQSLLQAGADRVAVNTAAVDDERVLATIAERFGFQCAVLALDAARDANGNFEVVTHSGQRRTGRDGVAWARRAAELGAGEILLTSFDRDGTHAGYDLELLRAICSAVPIPVIASGGADSPQHMVEALQAGASAVLAASIFHSGATTPARVKQELAERGVEVRP
jgi:imidazoleglycerol phosphate synthase cyclase subunit